jgi:hypothetical protein
VRAHEGRSSATLVERGCRLRRRISRCGVMLANPPTGKTMGDGQRGRGVLVSSPKATTRSRHPPPAWAFRTPAPQEKPRQAGLGFASRSRGSKRSLESIADGDGSANCRQGRNTPPIENGCWHSVGHLVARAHGRAMPWMLAGHLSLSEISKLVLRMLSLSMATPRAGLAHGVHALSKDVDGICRVGDVNSIERDFSRAYRPGVRGIGVRHRDIYPPSVGPGPATCSITPRRRTDDGRGE